MYENCLVCGTQLYRNGFCSNCDQNQREKTRPFEIDFSKEGPSRSKDLSNSGPRGTEMNVSSTEQVKPTPASRYRPSARFPEVEEALETSDDRDFGF